VATSAVDDDLDGMSLDTCFGMEDMATLVFVLLLLKCQDLGDNKSRARIIVAKHLIVFIFIHLSMHGHMLKCFHFFFTHRVVRPSALAIMVRRVGHSKDLWPRPLQVKHLMSLVLSVASVGVVDDEALGLELLVEVGRRSKDVGGFL
jgi:hypothetical protein